jgi:ClpX C4-type zinc finger
MWLTLKGTLETIKPRRPLRCSFCGRGEAKVERLVAGAQAYICDTCIAACVAILQDNGGFEPPKRA